MKDKQLEPNPIEYCTRHDMPYEYGRHCEMCMGEWEDYMTDCKMEEANERD